MSNEIIEDIGKAIKSVASDWKKAKRQADKEDRVSRGSLRRMRRYSEPKVSIKDVVFYFMEKAYMQASGDDKYFANARQIMYAARPHVLEATNGRLWKNSSYFTQTLLKDYIQEHNPDWKSKIVWDARGHLTEPHTDYQFGIGGAEVVGYLQNRTNKFDRFPDNAVGELVDTKGAANRFGHVLFVEKEGFNFQLKAAGILEKWDIALMSTKGVPVGAACKLLRELGIGVLCLHDFDLAGFKILRTLHVGTRLELGVDDVIDIGLRLDDVTDLQNEPVDYKQEKDPRIYLAKCGATEEEQNFLVQDGSYGRWWGKRVEINMLGMAELLEFLETKFKEHGVKKIIPDRGTLEKAYERAVYLLRVEEYASELREEIFVELPDDIEPLVNDKLKESPKQAWDEAVWELAKETENTY